MKRLICIILLPIFFISCNEDKRSEQAKEILSRQKVEFLKPPRNIPSTVSVDAPLMGNGFTGVAISGEPQKQVYYIARNDFWRLKSALDESFPLVLGKIEFDIPSLEGASYNVSQDLYNAVTTSRFEKDGSAVVFKSYVAADDDMMIIEISSDSEVGIKGRITLSLPSEKEVVNSPPLERVFSDRRDLAIDDNGISCLWRAFDEDVDIPTKAAAAMLPSCSDGEFILSKDKPLIVKCAFSSNFKSDDPVLSVKEMVQNNDIKSVEKRHKEWWKTYWEKSFVSIPDSDIERQYYLSLYGMASCSRDADFPPPIFGTWITCERPAWNGDYHLNYNHMAPYYALYSANRIEQADPYYAPLLALIPRGEYYSKEITGVDGGIILPVGVGPLGIETTRRSPFMEQYFNGWIESGNVEAGGLFYGQKSNTSYGVANISTQFYRTWDKDFAHKVYPYVKGVAAFWSGYLPFEDGRYVIYNDAIHEGTVGTKNPVLSLGLVRMVMQTAIDMSEYLGEDEPLRAKWSHIKENISDYTTQIRDSLEVFRYTENGTAWWRDNTLGIQHIYPAGAIGLQSDPKLLKIAHNTISVMQRWIDFNGSNSFFPAAVRVGYDADTVFSKLKQYSLHTYPNGFQAGNPHGIENFSTVPNTINEMMCTGHQGVLRIFHVWPKDKDAMFDNIRAEGAFLVSSSVSGGKVSSVRILSEKGRSLNLLNPWGEAEVLVTADDGSESRFMGRNIEMSTSSGVTYVVSEFTE